jgi:hypothetical protein
MSERYVLRNTCIVMDQGSDNELSIISNTGVLLLYAGLCH